MTATPYEQLGDLPLPRLHIPTWFGITSPSENNDALLDLNLLVNENNNPMYTIDSNIIPVEEDKGEYLLDMGGTHVEDHIGYKLSSNFEEYTTNITLNNNLTIPIWHTLEYNDTGVTYIIYAINKDLAWSKWYQYNWNQIITTSKISSVARLVESFWKTYLKNLLDATEDVAQYSNAIQTGCPSRLEFLQNQVKNSDYLIDGNEDSRLDPIQIIEVSYLKDQLIIGDNPPREGSIIAYSSDLENYLEDTSSAHVLYFKHADLHRFNFTIPHNHVIDRIEKLYRYDKNNNSITNLDTTVDTPDISSYKLVINSTNDGSIVSGTTKLILIEGGY